MSRGIEREDAEKLLINGFFNEVLKQDGWEEISKTVAKTILDKYVKVRKGK
jgi:Fe-S cluster assembly scaffold protein SufB